MEQTATFNILFSVLDKSFARLSSARSTASLTFAMPPASGFARALREAAPCLSKRFFDCSNRSHGLVRFQQTRRLSTKPNRSIDERSAVPIHPLTRPANIHSKRQINVAGQFSRAFSVSVRSKAVQQVEAETQSDSHGSAGEEAGDKTKSQSSFFPDTSSNTVAYWLLGSAASVFGIVVFGGLTRLTESGYVPSQSTQNLRLGVAGH